MLGMHHKTGRRWNGTDLAALLGAELLLFLVYYFYCANSMMHGPSLLQGRGDVTGLCWLEPPVPPALGQNGDESELFIPSLGYS